MTLQEPWDLLSEGLPPAAQDRTDQPSYPHPDHDLPTVDRHIPHREPLRDRWRLYALTPAAGWGWW
jgi:hypothetical protein